MAYNNRIPGIPDYLHNGTLLVRLDPVKEKIGSIVIPETIQGINQTGTQMGTVVKIDKFIFFDEKRNDPDYPIPMPGDRIAFKQYSGFEQDINGVLHRVISEKDVIESWKKKEGAE